MKKLMYTLCLALSAMLLFSGCEKENADGDPTKFTVTFNSGGGSAVAAVQVEEGKKLTKPTDPTNGEYIFVGWFKEATWVTPWNFESDVVTRDITLYAKWTTVTYTVAFNTNGGSTVAPATVAKGSPATRPLPPTKNGAAFDNWYKEAALINVYDFSTPVMANVTLFAKWITVTLESLQTLVSEAEAISSSDYTRESYEAMRLKLDAARDVLYAIENPTAEQIATAYNDLSTAMNALVARPYRAVVDIEIYGLIDNVLYVTPGESFNLNAYAVAAGRESATNSKVLCSYNADQLTTWTDGEIHLENQGLWFMPKSTLTAGQTTSVTVKSVENPAISKTITLKVAGEEESKTMFINLINTLPTPAQISYEHYETINSAFEIYYNTLSWQDREDPAVVAAYQKLRACDDAYYDLPMRIKYRFSGNVCTFTGLVGANEEEDAGQYVYVAVGTFPAGTYTQQGWTQDGDYGYFQSRLTFRSDGTGFMEGREADDANGTGATAWEEESTFTYTNQGTQAAGGMFLMQFDWNEEEVVPVPPVPGSKSIRVGVVHKMLRNIR